MQKAEWLSQVRKGILEYCILSIIKNKSIYGYDLLSILNQHAALSTTEGTVYPLLRRLEKNGFLVSTWEKTVPGTPPRKYYDLTEDGKNMLTVMDEEWSGLLSAITEIKNS